MAVAARVWENVLEGGGLSMIRGGQPNASTFNVELRGRSGSARSHRRLGAALLGVTATAALILVVPSSRDLVLQSLGRSLVVSDKIEHADIAVMTTEDAFAGALELADLLHEHIVERVGFLVPRASQSAGEMKRRGVQTTDSSDILAQLGVPANLIAQIAAGEGGTNEGSQGLAAWCVRHQIRRLIVVTSPDHSRRVQRTLSRSFGRERPTIFIRSSRFSEFRPDNWWQSRTTLRTGLMELEHLALDYVQHPWS